jgi:hypothetical protein
MGYEGVSVGFQNDFQKKWPLLERGITCPGKRLAGRCRAMNRLGGCIPGLSGPVPAGW